MAASTTRTRKIIDAVQVLSVPSYDSFIVPDATAAPAALTSATIGYPVTGYPCYACVSAGAIGIPIPQAVITQGNAVTISVQLADTSYNGTCNVAFTLNKGFTTVSNGNVNFACAANRIYVVAFAGTVPTGKTSGNGTLRATLTAGSTTSTVTQRLFLK